MSDENAAKTMKEQSDQRKHGDMENGCVEEGMRRKSGDMNSAENFGSLCKCDLHDTVLLYCSECELITCTQCEQMHKTHQMMKLSEICKVNKTKMKQEVEKVKNLIRYSNIVLHDLQHYVDRLNANLSEITDEILRRAELLPEGQESVVELLIKEIQDEHDLEEMRLRRKISDFDQFISSAKTCVINSERLIDSGEVKNVIVKGKSVIKSVRSLELSLPECLPERCIYVLTPIPEVHGDKTLTPEEILGEFSKEHVPWRIEVKRINTFRPEGISARCVTTMCQAENGQVWVVWQWGPLIHLVNKNGDIKKKIDLGCKMDALCTLKDGLAVSCHVQKCIKLLNRQHEVMRTFETEKVPRGIYANSKNEVFICEVEHMHRKNNDTSSIVKLDINNGDTSVLPCSDHLLQPCRVAVNINDDILVSDRNKGSVMVFDQEGTLKSTYSGPDISTRHLFAPESVRCDRYGQILVVDYTNHTVHVLDPIGRFRGFLIMDTELEKRAIFMGTSSPFSITIDSVGDLWVGNKFGYLTVLKYYV